VDSTGGNVQGESYLGWTTRKPTSPPHQNAERLKISSRQRFGGPEDHIIGHTAQRKETGLREVSVLGLPALFENMRGERVSEAITAIEEEGVPFRKAHIGRARKPHAAGAKCTVTARDLKKETKMAKSSAR